MNGADPHSFFLKQKNMVKKILKITIILFILIFFVKTVDAFTHKPNLCTEGCHQKISFDYDDDDLCDSCHSGYNKNMEQMKSNHNPRICKECHNVNDEKTQHTVHKDVDCSSCHKVQGNKVSTPKNANFTKCESCHTMEIHTLHQDKASDLCSTCHGSTVSGKILPSSSTSKISTSKISINTATDYLQFTLYEIFKMLIISLEGETI